MFCPIRLSCGQACGVLSWLMWEGPLHYGNDTVELAGLGPVRRQAEEATRSEPVSSTIPWPLNHFLPAGSCPYFLQWWTVVCTPTPTQLLWLYVLITAIERPLTCGYKPSSVLRRGHQIPQNGHYGWLWVTTWVLWTEPGTSLTAVSAFNHWHFSSTLTFLFTGTVSEIQGS